MCASVHLLLGFECGVWWWMLVQQEGPEVGIMKLGGGLVVVKHPPCLLILSNLQKQPMSSACRLKPSAAHAEDAKVQHASQAQPVTRREDSLLLPCSWCPPSAAASRKA